MIKLTRREHETFDWLVTEFSPKEIAYNMGVTDGTLKTYASRVYSKLGCQGRVQLIVRAYQGKLPVQPRDVVASPS